MVGLVSYLLLVGLVLFWSRVRPAVAIAPYLFYLGIEQWLQQSGPIFQRYSMLFDLTVAGLVAIALVQVQRLHGSQALRFTKLQVSILFLTLYVVVTGIWAPDHDQFLNRWKIGLPLAAMYCLSPLLIVNRQDLSTLFWTIIIIGCPLVVANLFFAEWGVRGLAFRTESGQILDSQGAVLEIADIGASVAIVAAFLRSKRYPFWNFARWIVVGLGIALCVKTQSRGPTISSILIIGSLVPYASGRVNNAARAWTFLTIAGLLSVTLYFAFPLLDARASRWHHIGSTVDGRVGMWQLMLRVWIESGPFAWFFGLGSTASFAHLRTYPHNVPIELLCEAGFIGATLYLSVLHRAFSTFRRAYRISVGLETRMVLLLTALIGHSFLMSLKSGSMYVNSDMFVYLIILERTLKSMISDRTAAARRNLRTVPSQETVAVEV